MFTEWKFFIFFRNLFRVTNEKSLEPREDMSFREEEELLSLSSFLELESEESELDL